MTDFTNLAALVAQGQALLDLVKGGHITQLEADNAAKLGEVDKALALKIAQANTDVANATAAIEDKVPHIQMSRNQELIIGSGTVPDDLEVSGFSILTLHEFVDMSVGGRSASAIAELTNIEADIKEQFQDFSIAPGGGYAKDFNILKFDWDNTVGFETSEFLVRLGTYLKGSAKVTGNEYTAAAFVKVLSGTVSGDWVDGYVEGKWRFCSKIKRDVGFGRYSNATISSESQTGSMLIALPLLATGVISHPKNLFKNTEFQGV
jgi:hypothetical protein